MIIVAVVTEEPHRVRKYEHARFSSLEMALLACRFPPRLAPPGTFSLEARIFFHWSILALSCAACTRAYSSRSSFFWCCDEQSESRKGLGLWVRITAVVTDEALLV